MNSKQITIHTSSSQSGVQILAGLVVVAGLVVATHFLLGALLPILGMIILFLWLLLGVYIVFFGAKRPTASDEEKRKTLLDMMVKEEQEKTSKEVDRAKILKDKSMFFFAFLLLSSLVPIATLSFALSQTYQLNQAIALFGFAASAAAIFQWTNLARSWYRVHNADTMPPNSPSVPSYIVTKLSFVITTSYIVTLLLIQFGVL